MGLVEGLIDHDSRPFDDLQRQVRQVDQMEEDHRPDDISPCEWIGGSTAVRISPAGHSPAQFMGGLYSTRITAWPGKGWVRYSSACAFIYHPIRVQYFVESPLTVGARQASLDFFSCRAWDGSVSVLECKRPAYVNNRTLTADRPWL